MRTAASPLLPAGGVDGRSHCASAPCSSPQRMTSPACGSAAAAHFLSQRVLGISPDADLTMSVVLVGMPYSKTPSVTLGVSRAAALGVVHCSLVGGSLHGLLYIFWIAHQVFFTHTGITRHIHPLTSSPSISLHPFPFVQGFLHLLPALVLNLWTGLVCCYFRTFLVCGLSPFFGWSSPHFPALSFLHLDSPESLDSIGLL